MDMRMKNLRSRGLRGVGSSCSRHDARSWLEAMLSVSVLVACVPASSRSVETAASGVPRGCRACLPNAENDAVEGVRGSGLELDVKASQHRPLGDGRPEKERERLHRRRALERLRLELHIRDHDGRFVRDAG
jgi:hypothetical protein